MGMAHRLDTQKRKRKIPSLLLKDPLDEDPVPPWNPEVIC